jgi:hypothetical protein
MKKILLLLSISIYTLTLQAQDKNQPETKAPAQWAMIPNLAMKGENGLLIINLPVPATMAFTVAHAGDPKILYSWHGSTSKDLPPGNYDVTFWNIKIPVVIEKGKETRIFAGVLNSTVKKPWEVWTSGGEKVFSGGGAKLVALPAGKYIIKTGGTEIKTTITDGQTSIFSFTNY